MLLHELQRLREILKVFHSRGFTNYIKEIGLSKHIPFVRRATHSVTPENLRRAFEDLGPTFIKLGQLLSLRPDIVPKMYIDELEKMQDHAPIMPFRVVKHTIEAELNKTLHEVFRDFNSIPIASASIAQVHKATLHNGHKVAVKVQRSHVKEQLALDASILLHVVGLLETHIPYLRENRLSSIIQEFQSWSKDEVDFSIEAENIATFRAQKSTFIVVPKVYDRFSTSRILTMEYIKGIELHNVDKVKKRHKNMVEIITKTYRDILRQVFDDGFFHADPHPGNILVLPNGKVALIDFGIVGEFDSALRKKSLELFIGIIQNDISAVTRVLRKFGASKAIESPAAVRQLRLAIRPLQHSSIKNVQISYTLTKVLRIATEYRTEFPRDFVLFAKTVITLEGLALRYDPQFQLVVQTKPLIRALIRRHLSPTLKAKQIITQLTDYTDEVPGIARDIISRVRSGTISVNIKAEEVHELTNELEHSSTNVALGAIIAALIIGAALIVEKNINIIFTVSALVLAASLGLWLAHRTIHIQKRGD